MLVAIAVDVDFDCCCHTAFVAFHTFVFLFVCLHDIHRLQQQQRLYQSRLVRL